MEEMFDPENCDLACQFEWIEVSSNFFSVAVYTPALIIGIGAWLIYKGIKKHRNKVY
jgi:ABC-type nickel/cobalt efflux system permease component RcnA